MADPKDQPIIIKKVNKGHAGAHGGAWKLAYADFVTAMMAFFLVMWIIGLDFKTKQGLAEFFSNPGAFPVNFNSSPYMMQLDGKPPLPMAKVEQASRINHNIDLDAAEDLASRLRSAIKNETRIRDLARYVEVAVTSEGVRVDFGDTAGGVFFIPGTTELKPDAQRMFQVIAPVLIGSKRTLVVEGHTDAAPLKDLTYTTWELSADRANTLRRSLYAVGVPKTQIGSVNAKADRYPKRVDAPKDPTNNRVAILVPVDVE